MFGWDSAGLILLGHHENIILAFVAVWVVTLIGRAVKKAK